MTITWLLVAILNDIFHFWTTDLHFFFRPESQYKLICCHIVLTGIFIRFPHVFNNLLPNFIAPSKTVQNVITPYHSLFAEGNPRLCRIFRFDTRSIKLGKCLETRLPRCHFLKVILFFMSARLKITRSDLGSAIFSMCKKELRITPSKVETEGWGKWNCLIQLVTKLRSSIPQKT